MIWLITYLAVPVVVIGIVAVLDRREFGTRAFAWVRRDEAVVIAVSVLLWPFAAVVIAVSALLERRKRRHPRISRSPAWCCAWWVHNGYLGDRRSKRRMRWHLWSEHAMLALGGWRKGYLCDPDDFPEPPAPAPAGTQEETSQ